jgi:hypothetical protein
MKLTLSKGLNRIDVSLPSPEERNRPSFRNVVFSSYLEFRTMEEVHKASDFKFFQSYFLFTMSVFKSIYILRRNLQKI